MNPMLELITSRVGALISAALAVLSTVALAGVSIDDYLTHTRLTVKTADAAVYHAQLVQLASDGAARDAAFTSAMSGIRPTILHEKEVINTIRQATPGPDACASAHRLINDTFRKEQAQ